MESEKKHTRRNANTVDVCFPLLFAHPLITIGHWRARADTQTKKNSELYEPVDTLAGAGKKAVAHPSRTSRPPLFVFCLVNKTKMAKGQRDASLGGAKEGRRERGGRETNERDGGAIVPTPEKMERL